MASGCAACHGRDGEGGVGPAWVGLAGSERTLDDGRTLVADVDYLRRSITDPGADVVAGYTIRMPVAALSETEVDDLVTYIQVLGR